MGLCSIRRHRRRRLRTREERWIVSVSGRTGRRSEQILGFDQNGSLNSGGGGGNGGVVLLEVGPFEYSPSDRVLSLAPVGGVLLEPRHGLVLHLLGPLRSQGGIRRASGVEPLDVVPVPEEELEVLGRVLDVDEVVHEVSNGARLFCGVPKNKEEDIRTGSLLI